MTTSLSRPPAGRIVVAWVRALRLQFYPMTWLAYALGALGAAAITGAWHPMAFLLGYSVPLLLEAATVLSNELFDYETDRRNHAYGPFNGGSRVLVEGALQHQDLIAGTLVTVAASVLACIALVAWLDAGPALPVLFASMLILGPGYTMPPLKLAWRGLGEPDVALTHSFAAVLWGFLIQGGDWHDPFPWLVSIPMFLAVLQAILLAELPDLEADRKAGKLTLAVRLGPRATTLFALAVVVLTPLAVLLLAPLPVLQGTFSGLPAPAIVHGGVLALFIYRYWRRPIAGRINGLLVLSLGYIFWFSIVPLLHLL